MLAIREDERVSENKTHKRTLIRNNMKKYLLILVAAIALAGCENDELDVVTEKVKAAQETGDKKEDVNFRIFKDRTKGSKEY